MGETEEQKEENERKEQKKRKKEAPRPDLGSMDLRKTIGMLTVDSIFDDLYFKEEKEEKEKEEKEEDEN